MRFVISGKPIPKSRPRFSKGRVYIPKAEKERVRSFKLEMLANLQPHIVTEDLMESPVSLTLEFHMPIPQRFLKKWARCWYTRPPYHTKKPDLDNLVKFVKDCLTGIMWDDDSQVIALTANKYYSSIPCTIIDVFYHEREDEK